MVVPFFLRNIRFKRVQNGAQLKQGDERSLLGFRQVLQTLKSKEKKDLTPLKPGALKFLMIPQPRYQPMVSRGFNLVRKGFRSHPHEPF